MKKPLDVGDGFSCASYLPTGEVLAITRPHGVHGMVELTGAAPFDEAARTNQTLVRVYRASLADASTAFLRPVGRAIVTSRRMNPDGSLIISLLCAPLAGLVRVVFSGRLQRPPYAEITDIAPLPVLETDSEVVVDDAASGLLAVRSRGLSTAATIGVLAPSTVVGAWTVTGPELAEWSAEIPFGAADDDGWVAIDLLITLATEADPPYDPAGRTATGDLRAVARVAAQLGALPAEATALVAGIAEYVRGCCALRVSPDESVIITDHRLLPLSWTRDAYYMALLLLLLDGPDDAATVERHLRWLWGPARSSGVWMRSHLTNGRIKDPGLQGDQQLFPVLELIDYRRVLGEWPGLPEGASGWGALVTAALASLPLDDGTGLVASSENPADDPSEYPLLFSTQLVYLRVLDGLAEFGAEIGLDLTYGLGAPPARPDCHRRGLRGRRPRRPDLRVRGRRTGRDAALRRRERRADRIGTGVGFLLGDRPSLGGHDALRVLRVRTPAGRLAHSEGSGPLTPQASGRSATCRSTSPPAPGATRPRPTVCSEKLLAIAAPDGHLPESYDPQDGRWFARHWFGWPAAAFAAALLSDARIAT